MAEFFWIAALLTALCAARMWIGSLAARRKQQMGQMRENSSNDYWHEVDKQLRRQGCDPVSMSTKEHADAYFHLVELPRNMRAVTWPVQAFLWVWISLLLMALGNLFASGLLASGALG